MVEVVNKKYSKLAIVSFILTIIGVLGLLEAYLFPNTLELEQFFVWLTIIGAIMALESLNRIKKENQRGKWFAWASIIISISLIFILGFILTKKIF